MLYHKQDILMTASRFDRRFALAHLTITEIRRGLIVLRIAMPITKHFQWQFSWKLIIASARTPTLVFCARAKYHSSFAGRCATTMTYDISRFSILTVPQQSQTVKGEAFCYVEEARQ